VTRYLCTVFTDSYLPQALTLWESLRAQIGASGSGSDWRFLALRIGAADPPTRVPEEFRDACLDATAHDLDHPGARFWYDPFEYANAIKGALHRHMTTRSDAREWWYVDADCVLIGHPDRLSEQWREAPILASPHRREPVAGDRGWDLRFLGYGVHNGGLLGVRPAPAATDFTRWFADRLTWLGFAEPSLGLFVDQRWLDLLPSYFPTDRIEDAGLNVAYWNFSPAHVCGRQPVTLLHFSQLDLTGAPAALKTDLPADGATQRSFLELAEDYRLRVLRWARRLGPMSPYPFAAFHDGSPITKAMRRAHYCDVLDGDAAEDPFAEPHRFAALDPREALERFSVRVNPDASEFARLLFTRPGDLPRRRRAEIDEVLAAIPARKLIPALARRLLRAVRRG